MKKILIFLLCIFIFFTYSCNKQEQYEINDTTNTTNITSEELKDTKVKLKKDELLTGNINIKNNIADVVFWQKINFFQTININFKMHVLDSTNSGHEIKVTFGDCPIESEIKNVNIKEINGPFDILRQFASELKDKFFILKIDPYGKVLKIDEWKIDEKYSINKDALNEINKYFSAKSLAMLFEKITYTGSKEITKNKKWEYVFSINNAIPISSSCIYDCVNINDYYYVLTLENSKNIKSNASKIFFPGIRGEANINHVSKGDILISKEKGILKRANITFDSSADIKDLVLLDIKLPTSINLSPLTSLNIEMSFNKE